MRYGESAGSPTAAPDSGHQRGTSDFSRRPYRPAAQGAGSTGASTSTSSTTTGSATASSRTRGSGANTYARATARAAG